MERIYSEVRCDYNDGSGFWTVDAWYPNNEQGTVIAVVNELTGGVHAIKNLDDVAKEVIAEKQKEIASERLQIMASYYESLADEEKDKFLRLIGCE